MSREINRPRHPLAGTTVTIELAGLHRASDLPAICDFDLEDWWVNIAGRSWMICDGNPACMQYGMRVGATGLPTDNEVVYGKIAGAGYLVHASEIRSAVRA